MAGYDASKVILKGSWDLGSGLTNGALYTLLPGGQFLNLNGNSPLSVSSSTALASVGVRDGLGLYRLGADARHLYMGIATLNAMTSAVGVTLQLFPSYAQPWTARCAGFGNPTAHALSNGISLAVLIPSIPGSVQTISGGSGEIAPEWFIPVITATTWPTSGTGVMDLVLACY